MLNQTNIGQNNNKFYVIQVIKEGKSFYSWNRWGRVVSVFGIPECLFVLMYLIVLLSDRDVTMSCLTMVVMILILRVFFI